MFFFLESCWNLLVSLCLCRFCGNIILFLYLYVFHEPASRMSSQQKWVLSSISAVFTAAIMCQTEIELMEWVGMWAIKKKREVSCGFNKQRKNIISEEEGERKKEKREIKEQYRFGGKSRQTLRQLPSMSHVSAAVELPKTSSIFRGGMYTQASWKETITTNSAQHTSTKRGERTVTSI